MRVQGLFLDSRVGRRIFGLFCIAVLLPTLVLSTITYRSIRNNLQLQGEREVVAASKRFALSLFERIENADEMLARIARSTRPASLSAHQAAAGVFASLEEFDASGPPRDASGSGTQRVLTATLAAERARSAEPARLLVLPSEHADAAQPAPARVALLRERADGGLVAGILLSDYLWGASDEISVEEPSCVLGANGQPLFCSRDRASMRAAEAHGEVWKGAWELFLRGRFGAPSWTVVTQLPASAVSGQDTALAWLLGTMALGSVLLVLLLSLVLIRKTMVPLQDLMQQTRRLGEGRYTPIASLRRDEFGALAGAFDEMGARVSHQLDTLNALAEVDRSILARDPLVRVVDLVAERIQALLPTASVCVCSVDALDGGTMQAFVRTPGAGGTTAVAAVSPEWRRTLAATAMQARWLPLPADASHPPEATLVRAGATEAFVHPFGGDEDSRSWLVLAVPVEHKPATAPLRQAVELGERIAVAITAHRRDEMLLFQARHDVLTGLPNRLEAHERLHEAIARSAATGASFAVAFFDLDRFKAINDGLGHMSGDQVLIRAGQLLSDGVGPDGFVARYGGDEFFAILGGAGEREQVAHTVERIAATFAQPLPVERLQFVISASVGIARYPEDGTDAQTLVRHADIAMYRAKVGGGGQCMFFEPQMNQEAFDRLTLENDLRVALQRDEIEVLFQPRVDSRSGRIVSAEALARWRHPERGPISPLVFIALAEECGLIETLGNRVLDHACRAFAQWQAHGLSIRTVGVNVSSRQLRTDRFVDALRAAMTLHGLGEGQLEIEITESVLVEDLPRVTERLHRCRELGASIAIDDFGTGYSSLSYLRSLPVDTLKIDREFMRDIASNRQAAALVRAMIAMGQALDKKIVAEGVETQQEARMLRDWGCPLIQGYVYYRPMTAEALLQVLSAELDAPADGPNRVGGPRPPRVQLR